MDEPKVSVIMPVYNTEEMQLLAAVASIQSQTYQNWECIICDDGSGKQTGKMLKKIADGDPRIRLIRNRENQKAGYARNVCVRHSCGRYIAIMDADDLSAPDRLEKQVFFLERYPQFAFVGTRGEFFRENIGDDGEHYWYCAKPRAEDFLFSLPYVHASILIRKEVLLQVHGYRTAPWAVRVEDYDLLLRLYIFGWRGCNLADTLYYIRRDASQYKRRKYRYRFHEAYMKYCAFRKLGLMPVGILYAVKPLFVGLLPCSVAALLQKRYYAGRKGRMHQCR